MKGMLKRALGVVAAAAMAVTGAVALAGTANAETDDVDVSNPTITIKGDDANLAGRAFTYVKLADYVVYEGSDAGSGGTPAAVDGALGISTVNGEAETTGALVHQAIVGALGGVTGSPDATYDAATDGDPMTWVANNLTDSDAAPYAGQLRQFVTNLETQLKEKSVSPSDMPENAIAQEGMVQYTMPDAGLYLIFDKTGVSGSVTGSKPMLVGTYVSGGSDNLLQIENINGEVDLKNEVTTVDKTVDKTPVDLGAKKTYTVKAKVPNWIGKTGTVFTITDTPSAGQTVQFDGNFKVTVGTNPVTELTKTEDGKQYTVTMTVNSVTTPVNFTAAPNATMDGNNSNYFTVDLTNYMKGTDNNGAAYDPHLIGKDVVLSYEVVITENALTNQVTNKAEVNNNDSTATDSTTPEDFVEPQGFRFKKVQADGTTALAGAEFEVYKQNNSDDQFGSALVFTKKKVRDTDSYYSYVYGSSDTTPDKTSTLVSDDSGMIHVEGLGAGTYRVTETKAPDGYLNTSVSFQVTISDTGSVDYTDDSGDTWDLVTISGDTGAESVAVKNVNSIIQLPMTGAAGTILFTALGLLVAGAGVTVYMKSRSMRRMMHA